MTMSSPSLRPRASTTAAGRRTARLLPQRLTSMAISDLSDILYLCISRLAEYATQLGLRGRRFADCRELTSGRLTVFLQLPLDTLKETPAIARVVVGPLLNAAYLAWNR